MVTVGDTMPLAPCSAPLVDHFQVSFDIFLLQILTPYPDVATAASVAGQLAGLVGDELAATVEAAVLADAVRARNAGHPVQNSVGGGGCSSVAGPDLRSEADWLVTVSRAFAQVPVAGGPADGEVLGSRPEGCGLEEGTGAEGLR
jgi:hypothetical protein